jgi:hypothetical protein
MTYITLRSNDVSPDALDAMASYPRIPVLASLLVALAAANVGSVIAMLMAA